MALHKITKGLDLPITGAPTQEVRSKPKITRVAIFGDDYPRMRPRLLVGEGDIVKRGQPVFEDRKSPGVLFTAPGAGRVIGIHRGERRAFQSLVIHLSESEQAGAPTEAEQVMFESYTGNPPESLSEQELRRLLIESGLWTALRQRPFSTVPAPDSQAQALFVTAIDSNPLAADPDVVVAAEQADFELGLKIVSKLTKGKTYLCTRAGSSISAGAAPVQLEQFRGPHPSGTVGLHIHLLHPVSRERVVWHLNYQDVIAIAKLCRTGRLDVSRTVALGGPAVREPRLVAARIGANLDDLTEREFDAAGDTIRVISGSVLSGKKAMGQAFGYLGRYHLQVSVLREGRERSFLGWLTPGSRRYSLLPVFLSKLQPSKKFDFDTSQNGSARAMVPIGVYERVMPMDILPTFLLRALSVGDVERAEQLGALELDEEDLGLCTFVCPGKTNHGLILRKNLQTIQEEG